MYYGHSTVLRGVWGAQPPNIAGVLGGAAPQYCRGSGGRGPPVPQGAWGPQASNSQKLLIKLFFCLGLWLYFNLWPLAVFRYLPPGCIFGFLASGCSGSIKVWLFFGLPCSASARTFRRILFKHSPSSNQPLEDPRVLDKRTSHNSSFRSPLDISTSALHLILH